MLILYITKIKEKTLKYLRTQDNKVIYNNVDLTKFAKENGSNCKIVFLDIIENQINTLKRSLDSAIKTNKYNAKFIYLYANKANYSSEMVYTAANAADGLETSSANDIEYTYKIYKNNTNLKHKPIVCNGFKTEEYILNIVKLNNLGFNITSIVDDLTELKSLLSKEYKTPLNIGFRLNLCNQYGHEEYDRFGLTPDDLKIAKQLLKNQNKLVVSTLHFHQRGFSYEDDKFYININKIAQQYVELKNEFSTLQNLDIGGGTPWFYDQDFNYNSWANTLISQLKTTFTQNNVDCPNLIIENGKYTVKDSIVNIYSVKGVKNTDPNFSWYILDTSLMLCIPEYFACEEPMKFVPLNNLNNKLIKTRLSGITCDCDDVYFEKDKGYILMPQIKDEPLYIAIIGTGSYQESMSPQNSVRHCLVPNENKYVSFIKDGKRQFVQTNISQNVTQICKTNKISKKYLSQFNK